MKNLSNCGPQSENKEKWKEKYLDLSRELKKQWNVTVIPIIIDALEKIPKGMVKGLKNLEIRK